MKKLFGIIVIATQFACSNYAQDKKLVFKVQHQPLHTYNQTLMQNSHSEVTYSGGAEFLNRLKAKGVDNPTITDDAKVVQSVIKTGELTSSDKFPLTIEFIKTTTSNGKKDIPDGTKIYGQCSPSTTPTIDSVSSNELSQEYKEGLRQTMQSTFSQISFPEKKLKIGEQFSRETPLSIPVAGVNIDMTITTTYKLISISSDTANFDIAQVYTMNADVSKQVLKATGEGKGKLTYDIKNNFYLRYETSTNMEMKLSLANFDLEVKSSSSFIQITNITTG